MKRFGMCLLGATLLAGASAFAQPPSPTLVVTASNEFNNQLLVFSTSGALLQHIPTGGAGGVAVQGGTVAVVNFGSSSVTLFERTNSTFAETQIFGTTSAPVSVAFSK